MRRLVFILTLALILLAAYTVQRGSRPDVRLTSLAVRATVFAIPTPTPHVIEVTRVVTQVVEVTRIVEVTRLVEVSATATPTPTSTPVAALPAPADQVAVAALAAVEDAPLAAQQMAADFTSETGSPDPPAAEPPPAPQAGAGDCPTASSHQYATIPISGPTTDRPDSLHGDLNLALRGYAPLDAGLSLVDINGPTDGDAPQLAAILEGRAPVFTRAYRVRDWDWGCGEHGCRGDELQQVEVSLLAIQTTPGELLRIPARGAEIYGGGYKALVVYADPQRVTLVYTREDSVANGYSVHLEDFCVDPNLLAAYQAANANGRSALPGLHNGEPVGTARYGQVLVAIRDRGAFADPRSRKDWWQGY